MQFGTTSQIDPTATVPSPQATGVLEQACRTNTIAKSPNTIIFFINSPYFVSSRVMIMESIMTVPISLAKNNPTFVSLLFVSATYS